jgi:GT2 family glycosyltransferase
MISVLMVTYYSGPILFEAIARIMAQADGHELVLVNNGNPEAINQQLRTMAAAEPRLVLLENTTNIGFGRACNQAAAAASGSVYLMLNPDCLLPAAGLAKLSSVIETLPPHWLLGADIRNEDMSPQRGARRDRLTPWLAFIEITRLSSIAPRHPYFRRMNHHHQRLPATTVEVPAISGAFMAMSAEDFNAIGGFDPAYFLHVEDLDLCLRWHKMGWPTFFTPHLQLVHLQGTSSASHWFIEWHKTQGFIYYFNTHFRDFYPAAFFALLKVALYGRFVVQATARTLVDMLPWRKSYPLLDRD